MPEKCIEWAQKEGVLGLFLGSESLIELGWV
jgi:hypothetical protein